MKKGIEYEIDESKQELKLIEQFEILIFHSNWLNELDWIGF